MSRDSAREEHELCSFTEAGFEDVQPLGSEGGPCRTSPDGAFGVSLPAQVLRYCHSCPRAVEALMNSYDHVRVSEDWVDAVPAAVVQVREHAVAGAAAGGPGGLGADLLGADLRGAGVVLLGDREDAL